MLALKGTLTYVLIAPGRLVRARIVSRRLSIWSQSKQGYWGSGNGRPISNKIAKQHTIC
jgi:hypothetical protein